MFPSGAYRGKMRRFHHEYVDIGGEYDCGLEEAQCFPVTVNHENDVPVVIKMMELGVGVN
jgi:hypothetical protein